MSLPRLDEVLDALEGALAREQSALATGDVEKLDSQLQVKHRLLGQLNEALRMPLAFGSAERQRVAALKQMNELNAALLAGRASMVRARAEALLGAAHAATYGAGGSLQPAAGSARAGAAA